MFSRKVGLTERDFLTELDKVSVHACKVVEQLGGHGPMFLFYSENGSFPINPKQVPPTPKGDIPVDVLHQIAENNNASAVFFIGEGPSVEDAREHLLIIAGKHESGLLAARLFSLEEKNGKSFIRGPHKEGFVLEDSNPVLDKILLTQAVPRNHIN